MSTELTTVPLPDPQPEPMLALVERAARDPSVDVDKMERLLVMVERMKAQKAEALYNAAMNVAQSEMEPVRADSTNPQTHSRYASYVALDLALRPIYTRHGFSLSFNTKTAQADRVTITCRVSHRDGHTERHEIDMPADGKGARGNDVMTKTHATGSATSYGMRYLLKMIFNVAWRSEDDDDGNTAGKVAEAPKPKPAAKPKEEPAYASKGQERLSREALEQWLVKQRENLATKMMVHGRAALDYAAKMGIILPNSLETLTDGHIGKWFPSVNWALPIKENQAAVLSDGQNHLRALQAFMDGEQVPEPSNVIEPFAQSPDPDPVVSEPDPVISEKPDLAGCQQVIGEITHASTKAGTSSKGPWVRTGICIRDVWYNTFHRNIGQIACNLKGKTVEIWFRSSKLGNDFVWIEEVNQ